MYSTKLLFFLISFFNINTIQVCAQQLSGDNQNSFLKLGDTIYSEEITIAVNWHLLDCKGVNEYYNCLFDNYYLANFPTLEYKGPFLFGFLQATKIPYNYSPLEIFVHETGHTLSSKFNHGVNYPNKGMMSNNPLYIYPTIDDTLIIINDEHNFIL
jgi:hypothetical protein